MKPSPLHSLMFTALVVSLCLAACAAPSASQSTDPIRLVANPWEASRLNAAVAKILIEEEINTPATIVELDEAETWVQIAAGSADATLEVWPSGHTADHAKYIDTGKSIEDGGALGAVGKIGWYLPSYMLEGRQELRTWESFTDINTAKLFATAETGDRGQFLAGDPTWVQYDQQIIDNLGMNLEVVSVGSEAALIEKLEAAVEAEAPILMYFWTPHWAHALYDLTAVSLPAYSEECYGLAEAGGIDCDYPPEDLYKIFATDLSQKHPQVYTFLKRFTLTNQDQIAMMAMVQLDGLSIEEAARTWIDQNENVWRAWLP